MGVYDGVTVLEVGNGMPSALAGMLLADNGAHVIKVEPEGGDAMRRRQPSAFQVWSRGKSFVTADLHEPSGRATLTDHLETADVLLVGLLPSSMRQFDLAPERLLSLNPQLIHCSITGWGPLREFEDIPGYEALVMAKAGGFTMRQPFRPGPVFSGLNRGVSGAAFLAVQGVTAALVARERTGRGQGVETSLYQGFTVYDPFGLELLQLEGRSDTPADSEGRPASSGGSAGGVFCTKDGRWLLFNSMLPHQHEAFLRAVGLDWVLEDERLRSYPRIADPEDAARLQHEIWAAVRSRTLEEWLPTLRAAKDAAFEVAGSAEDGLDHPQVRHNGSMVTVEDPVFGPMEQIGPLAAFEKTPSVIGGGPRVSTPPPPGRLVAVPADGSPAAPPLAGVTIIEFGAFYAMPFSCALLAEMGARVIKIEDHRGDPMRAAFPPPGASGLKANSGKESISVDLKTPDGVEIARELAARANLFVVGYRPGVAERLGLGYEDLRELNPGLSYVYVAGYGIDGPYAERATYGPMNAAVAGDVHRQAGYWLDPELTKDLDLHELPEIARHLARPGDSGDPTSALGAATVLAMTARAQLDGAAQLVVNTQIGSNTYALSDDFFRHVGKRPLPQSDPELLGLGPFYRLYRARSGWVFLACPKDAEREALRVAVHSHSDLSSVLDGANANDIAAALEKVFIVEDASYWERTLLAAGVGCVEVFEGTPAQFARQTGALLDAGMVVEVDDPVFGRLLRHGPAVRFSETPSVVAPACVVGQHTEAILRELGRSSEEIQRLERIGVVRLGQPVSTG